MEYGLRHGYVTSAFLGITLCCKTTHLNAIEFREFKKVDLRGVIELGVVEVLGLFQQPIPV